MTEPGDTCRTNEVILPGQFAVGTIGPADTDRYTFAANPGDKVNIALLRTDGGSWPVFQLYGPGNTHLLDQASAWYYGYNENFTLTNGGTYTLLVRDDGINESIDYTLSVFRINGNNMTEPSDICHTNEVILPGQFAVGAIGPADTDRYTFGANPGDKVNIALAHRATMTGDYTVICGMTD